MADQPTSALTTCIDLAVFAHNEAAGIAALLETVTQQTLFTAADVDLHFHVLANGCTDDTVAKAQASIAKLPPQIADRITLHDLPEGGKSRTMHRFIHMLSRADADVLGFMDADIGLPEHDTLMQMIMQLRERPELQTFTSRPVKDVAQDSDQAGIVARIIAAGGGGLSDYRKSICGQLFMMRSTMARQIGLPIGLPVEDGFMRAMMLTDLLSTDEDFARIDGDPDIYHTYESIRTIPALIRHQTRIVIGSAINAVLFAKLRRDAPTQTAAHDMLMMAGTDADWLVQTLKADLPRLPFGYVPFHFLIWRLKAYPKSGKRGLKSAIMLFLGFGFDAVVYVRASFRMMTRPSVGYW